MPAMKTKVLKLITLILLVLFLIVAYSNANSQVVKNLKNYEAYLSAEEYYLKGIDYAIDGKFEVAKKEFNRALETNQSYYPAKGALKVIKAMFDKRIKESATIHFFMGVFFDYKAIDAHKVSEIMLARGNGRANYVSAKHLWEKAIVEYEKAVEINPNFDAALYCLGNVYGQLYSKGHMRDKGINYIEKSNVPGLYYNFNGAYEKGHGKALVDDAVVEYRKAIETNPSNTEAYYKLAKFYQNMQMKSEAIKEYKQVLKINPFHAAAHYGLSKAYWGKEFKLSVEHCDKARRLGYEIPKGFLDAIERYR